MSQRYSAILAPERSGPWLQDAGGAQENHGSPSISVRSLWKVFGPHPQEALKPENQGKTKQEMLNELGLIVALRDSSFDVLRGETFVVMGLSGSGKSTLIRCINRLIRPTSGHAYVDGEDMMALGKRRLREVRRTKTAMVFQHFALFPHKTVVENVEYGLKVRGVPPQQRRPKALETLELVGLAEWASRYPQDLSGGMKQRVGLARALAPDPQILLMDEPFSALDPLIRREMQDELQELQRTVRKTTVFITHDLHEALKLGDRVAVMKDGRIVQIGTPEEILSGPADEYVAAFTQDVDRGRVLTVATIMRDPEALVLGHDAVRTAFFRMRTLSCDALYVVNRERRPQGLVTDTDISKAIQEGVRDLAQVMRRDFPRVSASSLISEVYGLCVPGIPVAVVNEKEQLAGVVNQFDVLANLTAPAKAATTAADGP